MLITLYDTITVHEENNLHICQYCDQAFPSKTVLNEHVTSIHQVSSEVPDETDEIPDMIHEGKRLFVCYICNESFEDSILRKRHMQQAHKGKKLPAHEEKGKKCLQWPSYQEAEQQPQNQNEINLVKPSDPEIIDTSDGTRAVDQKKLVATNLKCSICSLVVSSIEAMKAHVELVHGLKLKLRVVNSADKISTPQQGSSSKPSTSTIRNTPGQSPNIIGQKAAKKVRFQEDRESANEKNLQVCRFCDKIFSTLPFLTQHITSVHKPGGKTSECSWWVFKCTICRSEFESKQHLTEHITSRHEGKKFIKVGNTMRCTWSFMCSGCKKEFASKHSLTEHISKE